MYNSETQCVEESMHIKFDDKEPRSKIPELVESFANIQVSEESSEPNQTLESDESPEVEPTLDAHNEEASDRALVFVESYSSKNTYKYKSSHPDDLIIGNKESPRRIRSYFRQEHSMLGLLSTIEPSVVDETLSGDGWIVAMQEELN